MSDQTILIICLASLLIEFAIWFITDPRGYNKRLKDSFDVKRLQIYTKASIFLMFYLIVSLFLHWPSSANNNTFVTSGLVLFFTGMYLAIWAKITMSKNWGLPAQHDSKRQSQLVTTGPFGFTRNPIYLGNLLLAVGFSLALQSYSLFLIPVFYYAILKTVLVEEKLLKKIFGSQYESYMRKVPRFI